MGKKDLNPQNIARMALGCIQEKKGKDTKVLDVQNATILADYFVFVSTDNTRQTQAIAHAIIKELKNHSLLPIGREGEKDGWWILLDYGSVVVHIFQNEARDYYELDNYWGDCPEVSLEPILPAEESAA